MNIDRRRFLVGAGGVLALPLLESLWPRRVHAQAMTPPLRLVVMTTLQGMPLWDRYRPAVSGVFPTTPGWSISPILAPLDAMRDRVLVVSGVANLVRAAPIARDTDNHIVSQRTLLTARPPTDATAGGNATGPSIDFVAGQRLRGAAERNNILLYASTDDPMGEGAPLHYSQSSSGQILATTAIASTPAATARALFASVPAATPPPTPSRRDRLVAQRRSILDGVARDVTALASRLPSADRARLEAHTEQLRALEQRYAAPPMMRAPVCVPPDATGLPDFRPGSFAVHDDVTAPAQVDNLVMALACDLTRSAALHFQVGDDPRFPFLFGGDVNGVIAGSADMGWHGMIHNTISTPRLWDQLQRGFRWYAQMFGYLLDRLAATMDVDGRPLLDRTLVLWTSEFGNNTNNDGNHSSRNLPVVMAGLGGAFAKGRHLDLTGRSPIPTTGDVHTTVLRLLGGSDSSFGLTGTLPTDFWSLGNAPAGSPYNNGGLPLS